MFSGFHGKMQKCSNSAKFFVFSQFCKFWDHCLSINDSSPFLLLFEDGILLLFSGPIFI